MNHLRSEFTGTLTVLSLKQNSAANWCWSIYCNEGVSYSVRVIIRTTALINKRIRRRCLSEGALLRGCLLERGRLLKGVLIREGALIRGGAY